MMQPWLARRSCKMQDAHRDGNERSTVLPSKWDRLKRSRVSVT
jgi:hypothetical protein